MDRRMKRQIELENKKDRLQGKREYNECVRVRSLSFPPLDND